MVNDLFGVCHSNPLIYFIPPAIVREGKGPEMAAVLPIEKKLEDSEIQVGCCPYCGQIYQFETSGDCREDQLNQMAADKCDCYEAQAYRKRENKKKKAIRDIENLFGKYDEACNTLKGAVPLLIEEKILSISFKIDGNVSGKISCTNKGNIKVEKKTKQKVSLEG